MKNANPMIQFRSTSLSLMAVVALLMVITLPQNSFAHNTTKKKKVTVNVAQDDSCPFGVSLTDDSWGDRRLCVPNYPGGVAGMVSQHAGERIEIEADFVFSGDPKTDQPDWIRRVTKVAGKKVYDPCSTGKAIMWGALAGMGRAPMGTLPPGCQESLDASVPAANDPQ